MTTLDAGDGMITVINTFTVEPDRAEDLLALLEAAARDSVSKQPGFVSANFHVTEDRTSIINYAQWRSVADIDAMMKDQDSRAQLGKLGGIARNISPVYCRLRSTFGATGRETV